MAARIKAILRPAAGRRVVSSFLQPAPAIEQPTDVIYLTSYLNHTKHHEGQQLGIHTYIQMLLF